MITIRNKQYGINSLGLRILAVIAMILGLQGQKMGYGYDWMEAFGWFSLAIFSFLLTEGMKHTSDLRLYYRRVILFTLISEVCYNLFYRGTIGYKFAQSVMCSILFCMLLMGLIRVINRKFDNIVLNGLVLVIGGYIIYRLAEFYHFAFGGLGVLCILAFYVSEHAKYSKICELASLSYFAFYLSGESLTTVSLFGVQYPVAPQWYAVLALLFIWNYDYRRGPNNLAMKIIFYAIYPLSLISIYLVHYVFK